ncbi:hypothetical protein HPG69_016316 [Diceros bicornis minor]|uniref:Uncharacterized protein n=1 Tax=Diceros bicornis minor TaxID=77932 RepID=A0A7J7F7G5_DICBM|nr:hypothetical protein HPG69_016316 [Diceros bicornis minor]
MVEAMHVPAAPVIRPIIATNTYQQVQQALEAWQTLQPHWFFSWWVALLLWAQLALALVIGVAWTVQRIRKPCSCGEQLWPPQKTPILCLAFLPHGLQRADSALSSAAGSPLTRPSWVPLCLGPWIVYIADTDGLGLGSPLGSMAALRPPREEPVTPRELGLGLGLGLEEKEEAVVAAAAGLQKASAPAAVGAGDAPTGPAVLGRSPPLPRPRLPPEAAREACCPRCACLSARPCVRGPGPLAVAHGSRGPRAGEDKKKGRPEKWKRCIRTAAGGGWEDPSLLEWDAGDFWIFCGHLGNEVNYGILARAFSHFPSFLKAKGIRDKRRQDQGLWLHQL